MRTVLILLFVLIPLVGKAQEYSLEQYLEKVERENMSIKKAQNDTKQSGEDVKMVRNICQVLEPIWATGVILMEVICMSMVVTRKEQKVYLINFL